jgi:hypothetical protein
MGRLALLAVIVAAVMGIGLAVSEKSVAMGLCNCCDSSLTPSCGKVCAATSLAPGMCPAIVDYKGKGAATGCANPLNGMSLRDISLGEPTPGQLEKFRRFMEKGRRQAVTSYKKTLRRVKRGKISKPDFTKAKSLYDEALVNYYHGIRAYLNSVGTKSN